jgi:hypothetical protein
MDNPFQYTKNESVNLHIYELQNDMKGTWHDAMRDATPRTHYTTTQFKRPVIVRMKDNGRSMIEFSITEGKEMLIASIYPLPLIAMVSILGMRSCASHIRN